MRIRAFLGINLSVAVTRRLVEEIKAKQEAVAQAGLKVAWVPPANLHLTLKFLGSVEAAALEAAADWLRTRLAGRAPLELRARGLGAFPSAEQPRILWAGVEPVAALGKLQHEVEAGMVELGFDAEESGRAYHPHITVGRVKEGSADLSSLWRSDEELGASLLTEVVVYESKTRAAGAEYIARARVPVGRGLERVKMGEAAKLDE